MFKGLKVVVENELFEKALRLFKKKVDDDGLLKELRDRECFIKPSISRKLKKSFRNSSICWKSTTRNMCEPWYLLGLLNRVDVNN